MENEAFREAIKKVKDSYVAALINTKPEDYRSRDVAYLMLRLTEELVGQLDMFIMAGNETKLKQKAEQTIKQLNKGVLK